MRVSLRPRWARGEELVAWCWERDARALSPRISPRRRASSLARDGDTEWSRFQRTAAEVPEVSARKWANASVSLKFTRLGALRAPGLSPSLAGGSLHAVTVLVAVLRCFEAQRPLPRAPALVKVVI